MHISTFFKGMLLTLLLAVSQKSNSQTSALAIADSLIRMSDDEFFKALDQLDSLSLIGLIENLIAEDYEMPRSQIGIRLNYTSNLLVAGRNFGVNQYGLAGGLSFYHKTGAFLEITGYWNSDFDPRYNLTALSSGYIGSIKSFFSYMASYNRYIYASPNREEITTDFIIEEPDDNNDYRNEINTSAFVNFGKFSSGFSYAITFAEINAHRLQWSNSLTFSRKNWWITNKVSLSPAVKLLFGNQRITSIQFPTLEIVRQQILESDVDFLTLQVIRQNLINRGFTREQANRIIYQRLILDGTISPFIENNEFGVMNLELSAPLSIRINNLSFNFSYHYNFPFELTGESDLSPSGYFKVGFLYLIGL